MPKRHVIIVGAGASGLAAACAAAEAGAQVTVLEKNHVPGRKILSTGAGKCNFTNAAVTPDRYHGGGAGFLDRVLSACPPERVRGFFDELGVLSAADGEGRIFPRSMKAADVANSLVNRMSGTGAALRVLTEVTAVERGPGGFTVSAVRVRPKWEKSGDLRGEKVPLSCDSLILASGGPSYPQIGGSDSGYALARSLGHTAEPPKPALVPLKVRNGFVKQAAGVRLQTAAELVSGGRTLARSRSETLFTEYGVSGPAALELSRTAVCALGSGPALLRLDLFPEYDAAALDALLSRRRGKMKSRPWREFLCGLADERLLLILSHLAAIAPDLPVAEVPDRSFSRFAGLLRSLELELSGPLGFEDAMVSAGGVSTAEISPETFGSRLAGGLFITGELLDIDGDSGGYNLHFAWTSGLLAGRAAALGL